MQLHPDKNPSPQAHTVFLQITQAYDILSDSDLRSAYDEYVQHPERGFEHTARFYYSYYHISVWKVLLGLLAFLSVFDFIHRYTAYYSLLKRVKQTPAVRQRIKEHAEKHGAAGNVKKRRKYHCRYCVCSFKDCTDLSCFSVFLHALFLSLLDFVALID